MSKIHSAMDPAREISSALSCESLGRRQDLGVRLMLQIMGRASGYECGIFDQAQLGWGVERPFVAGQMGYTCPRILGKRGRKEFIHNMFDWYSRGSMRRLPEQYFPG